MKTIKETKLNTISSLTNTHMTKLLPQELSIYSKKNIKSVLILRNVLNRMVLYI